MHAAERNYLMPKVLTIFGMVVAGLIVLVFGFDLALEFPFHSASLIMDICFVIGALILGYLSFSTFREQK